MPPATNNTIAWHLRDRDDLRDGAFSGPQIIALSSAFGFSNSQITMLSKNTAMALERELRVEFPHSRYDPKRKSRAKRELTETLKHLVAAHKSLTKALDSSEHVQFMNPLGWGPIPNPGRRLRAELEEARDTVARIGRFYNATVLDELATFSGELDRRRVYDVRREIVCNMIFGLWTEAGRPLTYTTDPITSQRGGPLIDFVRAVVQCITEPASTLGGEAIKTEIERFRGDRTNVAAT